MSLKRIRLTLARDHDFPNGSLDRGYDLIAPIDADGHLDAAEWREHRDRCRVRRFWPGQPEEIGRLVHKRGGSHGATWAFDYDPQSAKDDEPGFKLDQHKLVPGEYVSITEHDGVQRTFFIKAVVDLD
ncbi:MAG: hypothetical protein ACKVP7_25650 [Hyphomicrobiaceae bacterium]